MYAYTFCVSVYRWVNEHTHMCLQGWQKEINEISSPLSASELDSTTGQ